MQFQRLRYGRNWALTLIYNAKYHLTYCWAHKVASTSWNQLFFSLDNINNVSSLLKGISGLGYSNFIARLTV